MGSVDVNSGSSMEVPPAPAPKRRRAVQRMADVRLFGPICVYLAICCADGFGKHIPVDPDVIGDPFLIHPRISLLASWLGNGSFTTHPLPLTRGLANCENLHQGNVAELKISLTTTLWNVMMQESLQVNWFT